MESGVLAEPARSLGIALGDQVGPDDVEILNPCGGFGGVAQRECHSIDVALPGRCLPGAFFEAVARFQ